jgi:hypothetical protein
MVRLFFLILSGRQDREYPIKGSLGGWNAFVNAKRKNNVLKED